MWFDAWASFNSAFWLQICVYQERKLLTPWPTWAQICNPSKLCLHFAILKFECLKNYSIICALLKPLQSLTRNVITYKKSTKVVTTIWRVGRVCISQLESARHPPEGDSQQSVNGSNKGWVSIGPTFADCSNPYIVDHDYSRFYSVLLEV